MANTNAPGTGNQPTHRKIAPPPDFDGDRTKSRFFFNCCQATIHAYRNTTLYNDDEDKIALVLSHMKDGEAKDWATAKFEEAFRKNPYDFGTWTTFVNEFKKSFMSAEDETQARTEIIHLKQTPGMTVDEYNTKFKTLITRCNFDKPDEHCSTYRSGIRPGILMNIARGGSFPTTLSAWYTLAAAIDNAERETKMVINLSNPNPTNNRSNRNTNRSTNSNATITTTTNNTSTPRVTNTVPKLTPEERE